jgi:arylsulfatase A-like enzyme
MSVNKSLNRRDFLKLAGLFSANLAAPKLMFRPGSLEYGAGENVLIIVFDAFSAKHISLYGYGRETTPNLARLVERGTVYHQHYANGPFTTPGTASLLTGTLPFTHRALDHNKQVANHISDKSIFHAFDTYHCMAYSHNPLANTLLKQFLPAIDHYTPQGKLFLDYDPFLDYLKDDDIAPLAWTRIIKQVGDGKSYSLWLSRLFTILKQGRSLAYERRYPRGFPYIYEDTYYILDHAIDWLQTLTTTAPQPFMGYFHFLPPHFPYKTRDDFYDQFLNDGFTPIEKPDHIFKVKRSEGRVDEFRRWYDEFILHVDSEFARLYDYLEQNDILKNTWLVLTSDHGEMLERGITGHLSPPMFQPLVHIPLVIFSPDQSSRVDIYEKTNAIDVLPTLLHVTGQEIPDWVEGHVLPPFSDVPLPADRPIYSLRGKGIEEGQPIHKGSAMIIRDGYKLFYVFGYVKDLKGGELIELYNLEEDPEELNDLANTRPDIVNRLLDELKVQLARTQ